MVDYLSPAIGTDFYHSTMAYNFVSFEIDLVNKSMDNNRIHSYRDSVEKHSSHEQQPSLYKSPRYSKPQITNEFYNSRSEWKKIYKIPNGKSIDDFFLMGNMLSICQQNGNYSRPILHEAIDIVALEYRIIKIIMKNKLPASAGGDNLWRRLCEKLLNMEPHINVMKVYDVLENDQAYFIVTEKLGGGELFDFLLKERAVPEEACRFIMQQIFKSVDYLHSMNLLHRDIKPENLMFRHKKGANQSMAHQFQLTLIDFDTCKMIDIPSSEYCEVVNGKRRLVGTYGYLAPEVLKGGEYTSVSDMWSIGVILYILMTGIPPVAMDLMNSAKDSVDVLDKTELIGINFDLPPLPNFPKARDLCKRLLEFNPDRRIKNSREVLMHPWLDQNHYLIRNNMFIQDYNYHHYMDSACNIKQQDTQKCMKSNINYKKYSNHSDKNRKSGAYHTLLNNSNNLNFDGVSNYLKHLNPIYQSKPNSFNTSCNASCNSKLVSHSGSCNCSNHSSPSIPILELNNRICEQQHSCDRKLPILIPLDLSKSTSSDSGYFDHSIDLLTPITASVCSCFGNSRCSCSSNSIQSHDCVTPTHIMPCVCDGSLLVPSASHPSKIRCNCNSGCSNAFYSVDDF